MQFERILKGLGMNSEWRRVPVSEVCELVIDCVNKTAPTVDYLTPYKMIRTSNIRNGMVDLSNTKYVTKETYDKWTRRATVEPNDVLLTREAPLGEVGMIRKKDTLFLGQRIMQYRANLKLLDSHFLFYSFRSPELQNQFHAHSGSGSVVDHIRVPDCLKFLIPLPPLPEQKAIAHILGTLDDKIELNQQMNRNLEAIASAIFKSWFVDFDPVRAKIEGRQPAGMGAETAALFPDSFEDSLLEEIPKGWKVKTLGEVLEFAYGKALKEDRRRSGNIPVYGSNGQIGWHDEKLVDRPGIIVGRKGNPGTVIYCPTAFFPIDTTFYVVPKGSIQSQYYLLYALRRQDLPSLSADSAVPGLNRNLAYMNHILVPPAKHLSLFDSYMQGLYEKIQANSEQSHTLATLRDTLLPKLMSGEIRVKEAEKIVEAAA